MLGRFRSAPIAAPFAVLTVVLMGFIALSALLATAPARAVLPTDEIPTLAPLLKEISPAIVNISTKGTVEIEQHPFFNDPLFKRFFGERGPQPRQRQTNSVGSGVIVDVERGLLLTNHHVIARADEIIVTLTDRRQLTAKLVGTDPETDVAVLQIEAGGLTSLKMADSSQLEVGDFVLAIGNPFGLGQSVTSGIVSALGRSGLGIESYENFIQTDASINPGNSGGALVNLRGELVGINTAIIAPGGGNVGIGFAIPINMARQIMDQILEHGGVDRGRIGVQIQDLTPELAEAFGVNLRHGAVVSQVVANSPAEEAGLRAGDVVIDMNGKPVKGSADLRNKVGLLRVGDEVRLGIVRDGVNQDIIMFVGAIEEVRQQPGTEFPKLKGAIFGQVNEQSPHFGKVEGVLVLEVEADSPAWRSGLRQGDIITSVNRKAITTPDELFEAASGDGALLLNIRRGDGALFVLIR